MTRRVKYCVMLVSFFFSIFFPLSVHMCTCKHARTHRHTTHTHIHTHTHIA